MKMKLTRLLAVFLTLALMSVCAAVTVQADGVLTLPSKLQIIDVEAFCGDTSLGKVVVPEGTTQIRSKAFANSSLTEITLPGTLTSIADDAFAGCNQLTVVAEEGTYAYDWAVEKGYIDIHIVSGPIQPPSTVKVTADTDRECLVISWDKVNGAVGYQIYCLTEPSLAEFEKEGELIATINDGNTLVYDDFDVNISIVYYYRIKAIAADGSVSEFSTACDGTSVAVQTPNKVYAKADSASGRIVVSWTRVADADGYRIYRRTRSSGFTSSSLVGEVSGGSTLEWSDYATADTAENKYYYRVKAHGFDGTYSAFSDYAYATMPSPTEENEPDPVNPSLTLSGGFDDTSVYMNIGEIYQLSGIVSVEGGSLSRVTISVDGYVDTYGSRDFSNKSSISLSSYNEFCLDTSEYPFDTPGTYTVELWAKAEGDIKGTKLDTIKVVVAEKSPNEPEFTAKFDNPTKTITLGERWLVEGSISVSGGSGYLGRVTINAYGVADSSITQDFTDHSFDRIDFEYWYAIDTTVAPWNTPGTYNLRVWAKDTNGTGGEAELANMTLIIADRGLGSINPGKDYNSINSATSRVTYSQSDTWNSTTRIRYVEQYWPGGNSSYYYPTYWTDVDQISEGKCTRAAASMALSYIGIDTLPTDMTDSVRTGYSHDVSCYTRGGSTNSTGMQYSFTLENLIDWYNSYANDPSGNYSPVVIHTARSGGSHAFIIIGHDNSDSEYFYVLDSGHGYTNRSGKVKFTEINGQLRVAEYLVMSNGTWKSMSYSSSYNLMGVWQYYK